MDILNGRLRQAGVRMEANDRVPANPVLPTRRELGGAGAGALALAWLAIAVLPAPEAAAQDTAREFPDGSTRDADSARSAADSVVRAALEDTGGPGAVVVAVRDGRIVLSRGYGSADPAAGRAMSDSLTVLAVGSLAKPVTAAAALRLAARGALDLDGDLRERAAALDLPIRHDAPLTPGHLLTHTSGFDDTDFGDAARRPADAVPLEERLRRAMPAQSFAPGRFYRYSNHGYALLGWVLEEASGTGFAALLDRELFRPLGMGSSSVEQVPADDLLARAATGHAPGEDGPRPVRRDYSNVGPADGLLTTGRDMGRFLLALTAGPEAGGLSGDVREGMTETAFTYHDSLPGVTFAFQERPVHDWSGLEHTGGRSGFTSQLIVVPEKTFGLFVALNLRDGGARGRLTEGLLDLLLPAVEGRTAIAPDEVPSPHTEPGRLTGAYRSIRYNRHTVEKLAVLLGMVPTVSVEPGAGPGVRIGAGTFYETAPLLFRWSDARWYNVFLEREGRIGHLVSGHSAFERTAWWEDAGLHKALFLAAAIVLLLLLVVAGWRGWKERRAGGEAEAGARLARASSRLFAAAAAALLVGLGLLAAALGDLASTADYGAPPVLKAGLGALLAGSLLTVPAAVAAGVAWVRGAGTLGARLRVGLGALALIVLVALLSYWNLIGFNY